MLLSKLFKKSKNSSRAEQTSDSSKLVSRSTKGDQSAMTEKNNDTWQTQPRDISEEKQNPALQEEINVYMQSTPNPSAFKFITSKDVKTNSQATYQDKEECDNDLARALLDVSGVEQIYFFDNVTTATLNPSVELGMVKDKIISVLKEKLPEHDPTYQTQEDQKRQDYENLPEDIKRINEILDHTIRPGLQADGGDVEVLSYIGNELSIRYQGACGSCPSSLMGTLQALTHILREEFDPDIEVIPV